ncbi:MAG TPA: nicotinate-nucleotide adenylyltransferase [Chitinivibrionales bacterium]|jgi:nicotinate-nucleotide adenylyltransferase|nr:nicotinate-nucleotide adenylyltransferase [Chitinivibrionales bacterium]
MKDSHKARPSRPSLGVLGGMFDPIHNGHCAAACLARDYFGLEKVYLVPSGIPPHKYESHMTSPAHRLAMTRLAVKGSPTLVVWDGEIRRGGVSYSVDTVGEIRVRHHGRPLYFIIGSDNLGEIVTWNRYQEILAGVTLCVAHRPGHSLHVPEELGGAVIKTFPSPEWALSSTMIRRYLARGYSCEHLVPAGVLRYISRHGLYRKG